MNTVTPYNGIPISGTMLRSAFKYYASPKAKVERLVSAGDFIRLKRNLYMDTKVETMNNFLAANHMVSPSYITGLTALWYYDVIPETVYNTISFTTKRSSSYENALGRFSFVSCKPEYFSIGIRHPLILGNSVAVASLEKALCDHIVMTPGLNLRYMKETRIWLEEEMRMDMDMLSGMDLSIIRECAEKGRKKRMLTNIIKLFS